MYLYYNFDFYSRSYLIILLECPEPVSSTQEMKKNSVSFLRKRLTITYGLFFFKKCGGSGHNFVASASPIYYENGIPIYDTYSTVFRCSLRSVLQCQKRDTRSSGHCNRHSFKAVIIIGMVYTLEQARIGGLPTALPYGHIIRSSQDGRDGGSKLSYDETVTSIWCYASSSLFHFPRG